MIGLVASIKWRKALAIGLGALLLAGAVGAYAASLGVNSSGLAGDAVSGLNIPGACTIIAAEDSYVHNGNAGINFDPHGVLDVVRSGTAANRRRAYVRFNVAGSLCLETGAPLPANVGITSATLEMALTQAPTAAQTHGVYPASATWAQGTITWTNQPGAGVASATSAVPATNSAQISWNVTPDVRNFYATPASDFGWRVTATNEAVGNAAATTASTTWYCGISAVAYVAPAPQPPNPLPYTCVTNPARDDRPLLKITYSSLCTLSATQDTYVRQTDAAIFNGHNVMNVRRGVTANNRRRTYVRFDVAVSNCAETGAPIPPAAAINSAFLQLTIADAPTATRTHNLAPLSGTWAEATLSGTTQPGAGATSATAVTGLVDGAKITWAVTADVTNFFAVPANDFGWRLLDSQENTGNAAASAASSTWYCGINPVSYMLPNPQPPNPLAYGCIAGDAPTLVVGYL